jgi:Zn-dependent M16 (insulinase) family peptidase
MRKKFREKVLSTTIDNLVDVTEKYLTGKPNRSIVSSKKFEKQLESMHFELNQI